MLDLIYLFPELMRIARVLSTGWDIMTCRHLLWLQMSSPLALESILTLGVKRVSNQSQQSDSTSVRTFTPGTNMDFWCPHTRPNSYIFTLNTTQVTAHLATTPFIIISPFCMLFFDNVLFYWNSSPEQTGAVAAICCNHSYMFIDGTVWIVKFYLNTSVGPNGEPTLCVPSMLSSLSSSSLIL